MLRTVVFAAVVAAALAAKIRVTPTSLTLDKGRSATVHFSLAEPIICSPDSTKACELAIELTNPDKSKIALDNCIIKWTQNEWHQTRSLKVTAVENFRNDGSFVGKIVTSVAKTEAEYYKGEDAADINVHTVQKPSAHCSGTGDPHYTTFDNYYWHVYQAGRYVLYSNPQDNFEVQVATRAYPARHCAFAAREGEDVFWVNACSGSIRYNRICGSQECAQGGYPRVGVNGGRSGTYSVTFKSGRQVRASVSPYYMNMYATAPGLDYKTGTEGICGNFDGIRGNYAPAYMVSNLANLKPGQRPSYDLFNWRHTGPLVAAAPPPAHTSEKCTYNVPSFVPPVLTQPNVEDITDLLKNPDVFGNNDEEIVFDFNDFVPETNPMSEEQATTTCRQTLERSAAFAACQQIFPSFSVDPYMDDCVQDLSATGDVTFVEDAVEDMQLECAALAERDVETWEKDNEGNPIAPKSELANALCPTNEDGVCSGHGTCEDAKCACSEGFTGHDCGINKAAPPSVFSLSHTLYDTEAPNQPTEISVYGSNFWNAGKNLKCLFDVTSAPDDSLHRENHVYKTDAFYLGSSEVICAVPVLKHSGGEPVVTSVKVATSNTTVSKGLTFTYYDGICQVCDASSGACSANPNSCTIEGQCYRADMHMEDNVCRICDPLASTSAWTYSYTNSRECGPIVTQTTVDVRVVDGVTKDEQVSPNDKCISAENPLVAGDANNKYRYEMSSGDTELWRVGEDDGCVYAVKDFSAKMGTFDNLVGINAFDSAGNVVSVAVIIEIRDTATAPAFNEEGYVFPAVPEDAAVGTEVGRVTAVNRSAEFEAGLKYSWFVEPEDGALAINADTGVITVARALDYETHHKYTPMVRVEDAAGQFHIAAVTIPVGDVPEPPTAIALNATTVAENEPAKTRIGYLTSEDPEGGAHTYSVAGSDFAIEGSWLVTAKSFNYEVGSDVRTVEVTSKDSTGLSYTQSFSIQVTDVNEKPTDIALSQTVFSESAAVGSRLARVTFVDEDNLLDPNNQEVQCTAIRDADGTFVISGNELILNKELDFETTEKLVIMIGCADTGEPVGISDPVEFTITVVNANDAPAQVRFVESDPVSEDTPVGTVVGQLEATDFDKDSTTIKFNITSPQFATKGEPKCTKDTTTGATRCVVDVVLVQPLDFEEGASLEVEVSAEDGSGLGRVSRPVFNIGNVNEKPTGLEWLAPSGATILGHGHVQEGGEAGRVVGEFRVVDNNEEGQKYTIELLNHKDQFMIEHDGTSAEAKLKLQPNAVLDFELLPDNKPEIELSVRVVDTAPTGVLPASLTETLPLVVRVVDEPLRVWLDSYGTTALSLDETAKVGDVVATLILSGNDRADWTYGVELVSEAVQRRSSDAASPFVVDGLTLKLGSPLNHEEQQEVDFALRPTAVDADGNRIDVEIEPSKLSVTVVDTNEAPVFAKSVYRATVALDAKVGTVVRVEPTIVATDYDEGAAPVKYELAASNSGAFAQCVQIDSATGEVSLVRRPSSAGVTAGKYELIIVAVDGHDSSLVSQASLRIRIAEETSQSTSTSNSGASSGALAGIIVGCLVAVLVVCVVAMVLYRRRQERDNIFADYEAGKGVKATFDNPTFAAPEATYASVGGGADFVPGVSNPLYSWYVPDMSRQEATAELADAAPGAFVVRDSKATPGWHILDVKTEHDVTHEKVRGADGTYQLLPANNSQQPSFHTLPELVDHYSAARPGVSFVLDTERFSNPMYGMGAAQTGGMYAGVNGLALPNDPAAPAVPLKEGQVAQVAQIAAAADGDLYGNASDARSALHSSV